MEGCSFLDGRRHEQTRTLKEALVVRRAPPLHEVGVHDGHRDIPVWTVAVPRPRHLLEVVILSLHRAAGHTPHQEQVAVVCGFLLSLSYNKVFPFSIEVSSARPHAPRRRGQLSRPTALLTMSSPVWARVRNTQEDPRRVSKKIDFGGRPDLRQPPALLTTPTPASEGRAEVWRRSNLSPRTSLGPMLGPVGAHARYLPPRPQYSHGHPMSALVHPPSEEGASVGSAARGARTH